MKIINKFDRKNIEDILALTPVQEGLLFHYLKSGDNSYYFEQLTLDLRGQLDPSHVEEAWNDVMKTNEALRTVYRWDKLKEPLQMVLKEYELNVRYYDFSTLPAESIQQEIEATKQGDKAEVFNLQEENPFRVYLCKTGTDRYLMMMSYHHIIMDGWSLGVLLHEFFTAYHSRTKDTAPAPVFKAKFKDFVKFSREQNTNDHREAWKHYLSGFETPTILPVKNPKSIETQPDTDNGGLFELTFPADIQARMEEFAKQQRITPAVILYSTWGRLLQAYTGKDDIIFGTTLSGRTAPIEGIEKMVGLFINTVPMRIKCSNDETISNFLSRINKDLVEKEKFNGSSMLEIEEFAGMDLQTEWFDTLLVLENYPIDYRALSSGDQSISLESFFMSERPHYDLSLGIRTGNGIVIHFIYKKELFASSVIERMAGHFSHILLSILDSPSLEATSIDMLSDQEKQQLVIDFNNPGVEYPSNKTIPQLFREQVAKTPNGIALVGKRVENPMNGEEFRLTYKELDETTDRFASILIEKGAGVGTITGIQMERSIDLIICILGVLKSGSAYLPMATDNPEDRVEYMLNDSRASILVDIAFVKDERTKHGEFYENAEIKAGYPGCVPLESSSLAYIIYTSGTTGKPKGVAVTHSNFCPLMHWGYDIMGINANDRSVQNLSYYFDWSVWEIFIALTSGAALYTVAHELLMNPEKYVDFMLQNEISVIHITPTQWSYLAQVNKKFEKMKHLAIGAEKLNTELVERSIPLVNDDCRIYNMYGPTEATIMSAVLDIDRKIVKDYRKLSSVPIGKADGNLSLVILDKHEKLCPIMVPGELFIVGDGVTLGYLNRIDLTTEKFISMPPAANLFEKRLDQKLLINEKDICVNLCSSVVNTYRTGDLARWLEDGTVEFIGRIDHQVKIRGYRIELGEIESALLKHEAIKEAMVLDKKDDRGETYLCAYIISERVLDTAELRAFLGKTLPVYMIPSVFIPMESFPLNPNKKVDRKALPDPGKLGVGENYIPPRDEVEKKLASLMADVLSLKINHELGIDDNFFELGGHSLTASRLTSRIHKEFGVQVPLIEIFTRPSIRELKDFIVGEEKQSVTPFEKAPEKQYYALSSSQKRLYVLYNLDPKSTVYNIPAAVQLDGNVSVEQCTRVFHRLIEHHESLRTSFKTVNNEPVQQIHPANEVEFKLEVLEGGNNPSEVLNKFIRPFDLSKPGAIRAGLIRITDTSHILVMDINHIVTDGASIGIIVKEFMVFYEGKDIPQLNYQYKDYAEWQQLDKTKEMIKKQEAFWLPQFTDDLPVLNLPYDFPRPGQLSFEGKYIEFGIDSDETCALKEYCKKNEYTLYMVLLATFGMLLSSISNQEDIIIGTAVEGRKHPDLFPIAGFFINTLALRVFPQGNKIFRQFMDEIKQTTLKAFENQDYPFESLVENVHVSRESSRNPIFDVLIVLENMEIQELEIPGIKLKPYPIETGTAKFDITIIAIEKGDKIECTLEYRTTLFKESTIHRFIDYYKRIISSVLAEPQAALFSVDFLSEDEKRNLVTNFNLEQDYPSNKTIPCLFREQVLKTPDLPALVGEHIGDPQVIQYTYKQFDEITDRFAHVLVENGAGPGTLVGIKMDRSVSLIIGILGILKSGSAYLPMATDHPQDRIDYMLKDSNARFLVDNAKFDELFKKSRDIDLQSSQPLPQLDPEDINLAYVIYTSGTTGKPKGVAVAHSNFCPLMHWGYKVMGLSPEDRVAQNLSYFFDWSVWEIFIALTSGSSLYTVSNEVLLNPEKYSAFLIDNAITALHITPTQWSYLVQVNKKFEKMKHLAIGAEKLSVELVERSMPMVNDFCRIYNMYGPTEATIMSAVLDIDRKLVPDYRKLASVPIGTGVGNLYLIILNQYGSLCPVRVPGELFIVGDGVTLGYLNRPELTNEKFVSMPRAANLFEKRLDQKLLINEKDICVNLCSSVVNTYRTGDMARWLEDGTVEFIGRIDHQVKIRGYRIELGEIESALLNHEAIQEALVLDKADQKGETYLCAYIVSKREVEIEEMRTFLGGVLPAYMIPSIVIRMDAFPLNPNKKVDRKALPDPGGVKSSTVYVAPTNETEEKLVQIWTEVLKPKSPIGIDDNFFELGGQSILAMRMVSKTNEVFSVNIPLASFFQEGTVRKMARLITETKTVGPTKTSHSFSGIKLEKVKRVRENL